MTKIINLLPKQRQQELRYEGLFHSVFIAAGMAGAILLFVLLLQIGLHFYFTFRLQRMDQQIETAKRLTSKQENNDLKQKIRLINAEMTDFKKLADTVPAWSKVLIAFAQQIPVGLKINLFTADVAAKKIVINGQSPTRDLVIALYNNISQDTKDFYDIDYPLENVAQPTNVTFHFTFYINDSLLH